MKSLIITATLGATGQAQNQNQNQNQTNVPVAVSEPTTGIMTTGPEIISNAFALRSAIHKLHLATGGFSEHKALNEYYDEIVTLTDAFAESYQGRHGRINFDDYPLIEEPKGDAKSLISAYRSFLDQVRSVLQWPELQNQLDEIQSLNNKALYLLELS